MKVSKPVIVAAAAAVGVVAAAYAVHRYRSGAGAAAVAKPKATAKKKGCCCGGKKGKKTAETKGQNATCGRGAGAGAGAGAGVGAAAAAGGEDEAALRARFAAAGQGHVFSFVDAGKVSEADKAKLLQQLSKIDTEFVTCTFRDTMASTSTAAETAMEPMPGVTTLAKASDEDQARWFARGLDAVAAGEAAAVVLAGGQGSRLGFNRPKGEYDLGLPSRKTLFKRQSDKIKAVRRMAAEQAGMSFDAVKLPWYIMTSPMTDAATRECFEQNNYYGLGKSEVVFFCQGTMPCFTPEGKIMMQNAFTVAEAPDGNGGIYRGLHLSGSLDDMQRRGVKYIHAFAVDNVIGKVADPTWYGYCIDRNADMGCKVLPKCSPDEKIGALCLRNGRFAVVEYSDIDEVNKNKRNPDGSLVFSAGFVCMLFYTVDFLRNTCALDSLPRQYHIARKKISYADPATGATVDKTTLKANNGIKLESFIFDVCPLSTTLAALDVAREEEFSPLKNKTGVDSAESALAMLHDLAMTQLTAAGATVTTGTVDEATGVANVAEISPLASYGGEGLAALSGMTLSTPVLVQAESEAQPDDLVGTGPVRVVSRSTGVTVVTLVGR